MYILNMKEKIIDVSKLNEALTLLNEQLLLQGSEPVHLVVCGGSALIATGLVPRTTQDVDVVAMMEGDILKDPEPLPDKLINAAQATANLLKLPANWLNCGPADLFRMGLPEGFVERLQTKVIGDCLVIHYVSRTDQIHFKLYASVDRGGYHVTDLRALNPTADELFMAAKWCTTQDVSEPFLYLLKEFLKAFEYENVAEKL
jgi:hypothetical protein